MATECPEVGPSEPERPAYSFEQMRSLGLLWLINKAVFHPRGFALAIEYADGLDEPLGWSIQGDGSEPWRFADGNVEDEKFAAIEAILAVAREHGKAPIVGPES